MMLNLNATDIKTFVGSKNFEESRDFYQAIGFKLNFDAGDLAEFELGKSGRVRRLEDPENRPYRSL